MVSIVVAVASNNVIGANNKLIWHIKEDLKHFKQLTSGHSVIMGRKTYESIGRPLPNRRIVVVSRNILFKAEGCDVVNSLQSALLLCKGEDEVFIAGGGELYKEALPLADKVYLTRVHKDYEGDTFFPELDGSWKEVERVDFEKGEIFNHQFSFLTYSSNA